MEARQSMYAKIAIARKEMNMIGAGEENYRALLQGNFNVHSTTELSFKQLQELLNIFKRLGSKTITKFETGNSTPHCQNGFYYIAHDEFGAQKRKICALWKKFGYEMAALDTRVLRQFNIKKFAWLRNKEQLNILLNDLVERERHKETICQKE